ncbi:GNAT family N-acetyltransferase [Rhodanobacter sp. AS-Z3]|uniref:GNAT family N-acetyltransferase n=1 Tax=Rhodanobacter sp. AS-Z3 TaxID=3031330 RepID=UPI00247A0E97|nr:GNAT family N-acetyltransferase [Rhodanobacter sp. AS-Z3]WEN13799.1 GNAT family N-acetyltransferase [Rhodanobacter sp. AS-Z3]
MDTLALPLANTELSDGRLLLRPWRESDARLLVEAVDESVRSVGRWLPWCRAGYEVADALSWVALCRAGWAAGEHFAFPIFDVASSQLLGGVGLNQINKQHRSANLGYWVRETCQRSGVAVAAARGIARFGFEQLGLARIEIVILPDNLASRTVAERLGARFEAVARQRLWINDHAHDAAVYGCIPQDLA